MKLDARSKMLEPRNEDKRRPSLSRRDAMDISPCEQGERDREWVVSMGFTLVEIVVALGLLMSLSVGLMAVGQLLGVGVKQQQNRVKGNELVREGMEAVMAVRARDFNLISEGTWHPVWDGQNWSSMVGQEVVAAMTRRVVLERAMRGIACGETVCSVVEGGGIYDEATYWARVEVEWQDKGETRQTRLDSLISYWR